jgi:hypothetical protein
VKTVYAWTWNLSLGALFSSKNMCICDGVVISTSIIKVYQVNGILDFNFYLVLPPAQNMLHIKFG